MPTGMVAVTVWAAESITDTESLLLLVIRKFRSGLLLAHVDQRPFDQDNFKKRFDQRHASHGLAKATTSVGSGKFVRMTYAGRLVRASIPLQQVQKLLGHASIRTTQRYASHGECQWSLVRLVLG
ncbi:tyrosine-type recombinase/integrase [Nocardia sp. NPDC046763]|uniref:tyrosine-type recombinase/integrase n=1 Tax=Nocardia sp. NPDC046763 TaxID=3155256 RepID=UPI0033D082DF